MDQNIKLKKVRYTILIIVSIIIFFMYHNYKKSITHELIYIQNTNKDVFDIPFSVCFNKSQSNAIIKNSIEDSLHISLNYKNSDYVITYGKKIKKIYYYPNKSHPIDGCDYLIKTPISIDYYEKKTNKIFVYRIEKGKFRHICP